MMKKIVSIFLMATVLTAWWGCSSSDDESNTKKGSDVENVKQPPSWKCNVPLPTEMTSEKTAWNYERSRKYPNSMTAIIMIDSLLEATPNGSDSMAALIDGEIRCVAGPVQEADGETSFMLYIDYEAEGAMVDIQYFNSRLNKVFTVTNAFNVNDDTVGADHAYIFSPYLLTDVTVNINAMAPFEKSYGDMLAIGEGSVCYGVGKFTGNSVNNTWTVCCRSNPKVSTTAHVYYYSAAQKAIYQSKETVQLTDGKPLTIMVTFSE